jgi:hypothetical protein
MLVITTALLSSDYANGMVVLDKKMSKMNPVYLHKKFKKIDEEVRICILS